MSTSSFNAYLAGFIVSAKQTTAMRKILGDEFLAAAPLTELSYRIWRRIMREDTDLPEPVLHVASDQLLPELDFPPPAPFIPQRAPRETIGPCQKSAALVLRLAAVVGSPQSARAIELQLRLRTPTRTPTRRIARSAAFALLLRTP